jgi:hypothetical protein
MLEVPQRSAAMHFGNFFKVVNRWRRRRSPFQSPRVPGMITRYLSAAVPTTVWQFMQAWVSKTLLPAATAASCLHLLLVLNSSGELLRSGDVNAEQH